MRLPNGYGSIIKHKGNRRKPYQVRLTKGWDDEGKQLYTTLGWFAKKEEAMIALSEYNSNPYDIEENRITFADVFKKWKNEHYPKVSDNAIVNYNLAYKYCSTIHTMRFKDIRLTHLQGIIDNCGKAYPTRKMIKALMNQLFKFAMKNDIVEKQYSQYVDVGKNEGKANRKPFTKEEMKTLFENADKMPFVDTILIMIMTSMRVGELITVENVNVHLKERYMVAGIKTEAGKDRIIPISKFIEPYIRKYYDINNKYLITNFKGEQMKYSNYRREKFDRIMEELEMEHNPHECRHTGISLLDSAGVNRVCKKRIVGHSCSGDVTDGIYTHKSVEELVDAIDTLDQYLEKILEN